MPYVPTNDKTDWCIVIAQLYIYICNIVYVRGLNECACYQWICIQHIQAHPPHILARLEPEKTELCQWVTHIDTSSQYESNKIDKRLAKTKNK